MEVPAPAVGVFYACDISCTVFVLHSRGANCSHRRHPARLSAQVMINHMAKPEEILIEKDDTGEIVREQTKDTEALAGACRLSARVVRGVGGDVDTVAMQPWSEFSLV